MASPGTGRRDSSALPGSPAPAAVEPAAETVPVPAGEGRVEKRSAASPNSVSVVVACRNSRKPSTPKNNSDNATSAIQITIQDHQGMLISLSGDPGRLRIASGL